MLKGLVLKKQANLFEIEFENGETKDCVARKVLKNDGVFVGDNVLVDGDDAVCKVEKRKNLLIRPPLANIDKMFVVLAPVPKPDLYTVDKIIVFCILNNIEPVICINKNDLDKKYCEHLEGIYKNIAKTLIFSSFEQSVFQMEKMIEGICVLAGQSAVGKSSIINALKKEQVAKVDTFSKKIERGKQTTRTVQLFKFGKGRYLADTAGFSKLDERLFELKENEIKNYFFDFLPFAKDCKYKSCLHEREKDCGVCQAVKVGKIEKSRYESYIKLHETIKNLKRF